MNGMLKLHKKTKRFSVGRILKAPPQIVWRVITDTSFWPEWGPSVVTVQCNDRFISSGSKGIIKTITGLSLPFVITSFKKEKEWAWDVGGLHATGHSILPNNKDSCILFFDMPIWAIPYTIICLVALNRIKKIVASIKIKNFILDDFTD